ncbi:DinB family protein [Hymenobacter sp. 5516J-16]|uniref:DinB family protein n=1 Tax=Hymenobacter sublimis TaxID=2933777 RepID=A0ABY4J7Z3_9BACT|nr:MULTISPECIES: DinB family protein [Hymenobacter]UOQ78775.1 DinB family protein [Hymenobacter sp. 5516J-16]UPL48735.1 DinB family protein [Hymenobacter sublimis]
MRQYPSMESVSTWFSFPYSALMMEAVCERLRELLEVTSQHLSTCSEQELAEAPSPGRWSRKEILGHLIDSAANNHRRFVLALISPEPLLVQSYDQDAWVRVADYQNAPTDELLHLWTSYNRQLIRLLERVPATAHEFRCQLDDGYTVTLGWLIEDYAVHLEHHVQQILDLTP